jgi:hypothetical protein
MGLKDTVTVQVLNIYVLIYMCILYFLYIWNYDAICDRAHMFYYRPLSYTNIVEMWKPIKYQTHDISS